MRLAGGTFAPGSESRSTADPPVPHGEDYFEVYALTTDHPSHNYIVEDFMVCHNKKILSDRDLFA